MKPPCPMNNYHMEPTSGHDSAAANLADITDPVPFYAKLCVGEDIGRCLLENLSTGDRLLLVTARISDGVSTLGSESWHALINGQ